MKIVPARLRKGILKWLVSVTIPLILFAVVKVVRWHNDPHIDEAERAARKKLGMQIYGAVDCGVVQYFSHVDHPFKSPLFGDDNRETMRKVVNQYKNRRAFIYTFKLLDGWQEAKVIVGTRNGEIYEFEPEPHSYQWKKPTVAQKYGSLWLFDAGQKKP